LGSVEVTQTLYNGSAFSALRGAKQFQDVSRLARVRQAQEVANDVYEAFYQALLAQERARVVEQRLRRTETTLQEISAQVRQGVVPKFQRLSAEVERSNTQTERIQAQNDADRAVDNLKRTLGMNADTPVRLDGLLDTPATDGLQSVSTPDAVGRAYNNRADLRRARLAIELEDIQRNTIRAEYFPTVSAFANFNYNGRVPDDRTQVITTNPNNVNDPFFFDARERGFFNDEFWNPSLSVGVRMQWNLFNGFQTRSRMQQRTIAVQRAELQVEQLQQAIAIEVRGARRALLNAQQRIQSQSQNVERAEVNYEYTAERVSEGVSSPLELREASDQLDQSRLNYLQAVFDYLVARSDLQTAMGLPLAQVDDDLQMTMSRRGF
jgi:outer membrane protein TolC